MSKDQKKPYDFDQAHDVSEEDANEAPAESPSGEAGQAGNSPNEDDAPASRDEGSSADASGGAGDKAADGPWEPILLEGEAVTECPHCGAPMPGANEVVCLRCGFDLMQMKKVDTETGEVEAPPDPDAEAEEEQPPISTPGRGGMHLPAILTGVALAVMLVAYLAGAGGVFPEGPPETILVNIGQYFRYLVLIAVFSACVTAGFLFLGRIERRELGDLNLAVLRALAISSICGMVTLLPQPFGARLIEWMIEFLGMAVVYLVLTQVFFRADARDAATSGVVALTAMGVILLVVEIIAA